MSHEVTIVAFNYGNAGRYVNGPGMCLVNFVKELRDLDIKVNIFSKLKSTLPGVRPLSDKVALAKAIFRSKILHHWSGLDFEFIEAIRFANDTPGLKVLVGPNVLDTVNMNLETRFLNNIKYDKIFTVNDRLRFRLSKEHNISLDEIELMLVGPDKDIWKPIDEDNGKILWKGNSSHYVKDIQFALDVQKALPEYEFEFIGYPKPYDYNSHIRLAKSCHLYFSTSLSETMGLGLAEQWCAGIPSVTHPKIYLHGENYRTGIITNRTVSDYCDAIREIMEDDALYEAMSERAHDYVHWGPFGELHFQYIKELTT